MSRIIEFDTHLRKIISGGQSGVDIAGLAAAKDYGVETSGWLPAGFRTCHGPRPEYVERYNMQVADGGYAARTKLNVRDSDCTVLLASDFQSAGTALTQQTINNLGKPSFKILLNGQLTENKAYALAQYIMNGFAIVNIAGNSDKDTTYGKHFKEAYEIIHWALQIIDEEGRLKRKTK